MSDSTDPPDLDSADVESAAQRSAPEDSILAERLDAPSAPLDIYLEEASPYRPISTGDIFQSVDVPGSSSEEAAHGLTMLLAHPSAMRKGAELEPRARAAPVTPVNGLSTKKWASGHFNVFPLPLLAEVAHQNGFNIPNRGWGVLLELAAPVQTAQLDVKRRVACLSPQGVHLLLQRLVHSDTRFPVRVSHLAAVFAPKLEEIELLETWNEEFVAPAVESGAELDAELRTAAQDFEAAVSAPTPQGGASIRAMLESKTGAGGGHRRLAEVMRQRRNATGSSG